MVLMQQIVVLAHCVELAGPQTIEVPEPLQQYGDPELQTLLVMGLEDGQFEEELRGWELELARGSRTSRLGDVSAKGMAKVVARREERRIGIAER